MGSTAGANNGPATRPERRTVPRLVPVNGSARAEVTTSDGRRLRASVGDISKRGARLIGALPVKEGDSVTLRMHLDDSSTPFSTHAVVTHRNDEAFGARFT